VRITPTTKNRQLRGAYDIGCAISGSVRKHGNSVGGAGRDENGSGSTDYSQQMPDLRVTM